MENIGFMKSMKATSKKLNLISGKPVTGVFYKIILLLIISLIIVTDNCYATEQTEAPDQKKGNINFNHIKVNDGLTHYETLFVMQDSRGFMWFGTKYGLNRFDGVDIKPYYYSDSDPASITGNFAHWICEDPKGYLWIATWGDGISRYDPLSDTFTNFIHQDNDLNSIVSNNVWSVYVDSRSQIWAGTENGLSKLDPETGSFINYHHDPDNINSLSNNTVSRISEDDQGILWISTYGGGLNRFDPKTESFTHYNHEKGDPNSLSNDNLWGVFIDSRKWIWVASEDGLNRFDPETENFLHYKHDDKNPNSLSADIVTFIYEDNAGMLWLGTFGGGLNQFDPEREKFIQYQNDPQRSQSLSNNIIMSVYEDDIGTIWVATYGGIDKYDPGENKFLHYYNDPNDPDDLSNNVVRSICEDKDGSLWIGTGGGLNRFDEARNTFTQYFHDEKDPSSISDNDIWVIDQDKNGNLWIGTHGNGMNKFDPDKGTFIRYKHDPEDPGTIASDAIYDIVVDDERDVLWIASYQSGLDKYEINKDKFKHYRYNADDPDGIISNWTTTVFLDSKGLIWIGSESGLSIFDPETGVFNNFKRNQNIDLDHTCLSNNSIQTIFEDSRNNIWIGTHDGLNRYLAEDQTFIHYHDKDGLSGKRVAAITEDNDGNLWISTDKGFSKFDLQAGTFRSYNRRDGLQGNHFLMHSVCKSINGDLFFGGENGFNAFFPEDLKENDNIPEIVFTDFKIFNQSVSPGKNSPLKQHINHTEQIKLKPHQNVFTIDFVALNYRNSQRNNYAYIMEGFDKDFTFVDSDKRYASYTNLDPGKYTLTVKASNNDGLWNEKGKSIKVVILPTWYQTIWFKVALGILLSFFALSVVAYIKKLRFEIKQRKIFQYDLEVSEKKYRTLFESVDEGVCLHEMVYNDQSDPVDYRILEVNPAYENILGLNSKDILNSLASELYGTGDPPYMDIFMEVVKTGKPTSFETYFQPMDKYFKVFVFSHFKGKFATLFSDITAMKHREQRITEALDMASNAERSANMGSWRWFLNSNKVEWSDNMCLLHGIEPSEFKATFEHAVSFQHPDDMDYIKRKIEQMLFEKKPQLFEYRIITPTGLIKYVEGTNQLFFDDENNLIKLIGTVHDISQRKKVEIEIRDKSKELEKQFQKSEEQRIATLSVFSDLNSATRELKAEVSERKNTEEKLNARMKELELFNEISVDREIMINDHRKEINKLLKKLGKKDKYEIVT